MSPRIKLIGAALAVVLAASVAVGYIHFPPMRTRCGARFVNAANNLPRCLRDPRYFRTESAVELSLSFTCEWDREHGLGVSYRATGSRPSSLAGICNQGTPSCALPQTAGPGWLYQLRSLSSPRRC
jgi:hypothetical protein